FGICGSQAGGIIEYLADGSWTKRLHPGWAAHAGVVATLLAQSGFTGPETVFEGEHGFYRAFAGGFDARRLEELLASLGREWELVRVRVQALPLRLDRAPVHGLCAPPPRAPPAPARPDHRRPVPHRGRAGGSPLGATGGEASAAERVRREVQPAVSPRRDPRQGAGGPRGVRGRGRARRRSARRRRPGELR